MNGADIRRVAVLGTGTIGTGWATCFALHGREVTLFDVSPDRLALAEKDLDANLTFLRTKDLIDDDTVRRAAARVRPTGSVKAAVQEAQFIQENVSERLDVKQQLLAEVEAVADPAALFASSTSGLRITDIAAHAQHPERCLGGHPYNPPHLMPLVELTKCDRTDPAAIQAACEFYRAVGKEPIVLGKDAIGFVGNRLQFALYREAVDLVVQGVCSVEDVDKACVFGPGLRWGIVGPNLIFHLAGGHAGIQAVLRHIGPSFERTWQDLATWTTWPTGWPEVAQTGVEQEIAHRPPAVGNTLADLVRFRDDVLIELLRRHGKLPVPQPTEGGRT
jgi:carnitine 3-dehydrogenase